MFPSTHFTQSSKLCILGFDISKKTSPCAVAFNGLLYLFWTSAANDGIHYATYDGRDWSNSQSCRKNGANWLGVAPTTSPNAVVYRGLIYLFYAGVGRDGIFYTCFDGLRWTAFTSVREPIPLSLRQTRLADDSSPAAVIFEDRIYLFWQNPQSKAELAVYDGCVWCRMNSFSCSELVYSTPAAAVLDGTLYVFLKGQTEIRYAALRDGAAKFSSIRETNGPWRYKEQETPFHVAKPSESQLVLLFSTPGTSGEISYCCFDGKEWSKRSKISLADPYSWIAEDTCLSSVSFDSAADDHKFFWIDESRMCRMTGPPIVRSDALQIDAALYWIKDRKAFLVQPDDSELCQILMDAYRGVPGVVVKKLQATCDSPIITGCLPASVLACWYERDVSLLPRRVAEGTLVTSTVIQAVLAGFAFSLKRTKRGTSFAFHPPGQHPPTTSYILLPCNTSTAPSQA